MAYKNSKKTEKKIKELPSFLFKSPVVSENNNFGKKTVKKDSQLGPIFFGCYEYKPMFHRLNLGLSFDVHKTASSTENLLRHAFLSEVPVEAWYKKKQVTRLSGKPQLLFSDPYLHKCPGFRRAWMPEAQGKLNLGETISTIEGEASQEIPLYCVRKSLDGWMEKEYEVIFLSDIWEKRRLYMSSKERMAHTHFPKQFVTLRVIGPAIPASITIKKLPSKRKTDSQLDLELKSKRKKEVKEGDVSSKGAFINPSKNVENVLTGPITKKLKVEVGGKNEDKAKKESVHQESPGVDDRINEKADNKDEEEIKNKNDDVHEATDEASAE